MYQKERMNIKDYLHLYYGCPCWFRYKNSKFWDVGTIREIALQRLHNGDTYEIKPILRPLSDINYNEAIVIDNGSFIELDHSNEKVVGVLWPSDYARLLPEDFLYLLSKHFDLFELIPAGLAIDATTITSTNDSILNYNKHES